MKARRTKKRGATRTGGAAALQQRLRRTERRLREVEERHEIAMGAIREGVYDWDIAGNRVYFAGPMEGFLGLAPGVLKNSFKEWHERVHPEDFPRFREATISHLKGATQRFECDYRYRARDGTWHWARTHGLAVRDARGRAVRMIGSTGDITELKRAEDALRETEERYGLATSAAVEGIYEWDIKTGTLFLTDRAKAFFSLPGDSLTPAAWNARIHGEDYPGYRAALLDHFKAGTPHLEHEYRIADGRGGYKWVLDRGIGVRDAHGRVTKLVGALSDTTERKHAEIELRRARDQAEQALEQQTATAEILRVMASSPSDVQPVFEAIVRAGVRLFPGAGVTVTRPESGQVRLMAIAERDPERARRWSERFPFPLERHYMHGRAILECCMIDMPDVERMDESFAAGKRNFAASGYRAMTVVPMVKDGAAIGTIAVVRDAPGALSEKQIALLKTFADQAVIAIENVRLFNETREALEHQKAAGEVLQVISGAIADTQPVFDKILESCGRLFSGRIVGLNVVRDDGRLHIGAYHGAHRDEFERIFPIPLTRESGSGLAITERRVVHYPDTDHGAEVPARTRQGCKAIGIKSAIFAPVLWEDRGLGAIFVGRDHVSSFSEKEITLLKTFADQAAIAIENLRLFNETKEALERLTATSEVLRVISSSPNDLQAVFDAILSNATRICDAHFGTLLLYDGTLFHAHALHNVPAAFAEALRREPRRARPATGLGRLVATKRPVHIHDVAAESAYLDREPMRVHTVELGGVRTALVVPLLKGDDLLGGLQICRQEVKPFTDKQIALVCTFADQAVIAIENARLFREIQDKSRQLETANRHKSQFLANMSHELRTPLNAIIGFTRIVMRRSHDNLKPQEYDNLEKILANGKNLLGLINAILDLSKIEAGRVDVVPAETALRHVLEHCLRTVEPLAKVPLVKEFNGGFPAMYVDEEKLRQIVLNLLGNAAKFTERGTIRLKAQAANGSVEIVVADTGIGIPADKLGLIFDEFEQVDVGANRMRGTGLGLAIARRLARLLGGDIQVQSVLGRGSIFTLTLPLRYPA